MAQAGVKSVRSTTNNHVFEAGTYNGALKNGEPHDQGTYTFHNGDVYEGNFEDGKFHGKGTYTKKNGTTTDEVWDNGKLVSETQTP